MLLIIYRLLLIESASFQANSFQSYSKTRILTVSVIHSLTEHPVKQASTSSWRRFDDPPPAANISTGIFRQINKTMKPTHTHTHH